MYIVNLDSSKCLMILLIRGLFKKYVINILII
jgi:hypothetical protein